MIALPATLIKILLISTLVTALAPLFVRRHNNNVLLLPIAACFLESLTITYFYIYAGRASWKLLSVRGVDIEFYIEPLGLIFLNLLTGLWLISTLYTIYHMKKIDKKDPGTFLTFIGLTIFSAILVALSKNLFTMFIGYEMLTLSTIPLVAYHSYNKPEIIKYIKILLSTSIGLLLPFVLLIDHITGSTEFKLGGIILNEIPDFWGHLLLLLSFLA
ncbi:MAG UNVERIFIED_CONTAM: hypothetical protein LVQ98_00725 [Rickettsiaceae bacterium]|jgi:multicomponent Na+:H+ antiporter subunit D